MKKQVITIIITALVVSLLDFGIFYLCKDALFKDNNSSINNEKPNTTEGENKDFTSNGTYVVTYTDKGIENGLTASVPSTLTLNEDKSYVFLYNRCDQMVLVKGNYEVKDNVITLVDSKTTTHNNEDLTFTIVNDNEIYLNEFYSCTISKDDYNNGLGSFKKIY